MRKITVVGAGRVGESTAQILAAKELCRELVLIDIQGGFAEGVALDVQESTGPLASDTRLRGGADWKAISGSDVVVVTAGLPRKPGMSRSDVLDANVPIINSIADEVARYASDAIVIVVTNPVDVLTYAVWKHTGWSRERVLGLSGVLDATRMASFIAMETGYSLRDITTMVMGGHGDSMVPMIRYSTINGMPLDLFLDKQKIDQIVERTRNGGAEILGLKKTSSANDSPASAIVAMVDSIAHNRRRIMPCVAILDGEYNQRDIALGVPVILGEGGVEKVIELPLNEQENEQLLYSAKQVRADIDKLS